MPHRNKQKNKINISQSIDSAPDNVEVKRDNDYQVLVQELINGSEEQAMANIRRYVLEHGVEAFCVRANKPSMQMGYTINAYDERVTIYSGPLAYAGVRGWHKLCEYLIELGVDVMARTVCKDVHHDNQSVLDVAIKTQQLSIAEMFISVMPEPSYADAQNMYEEYIKNTFTQPEKSHLWLRLANRIKPIVRSGQIESVVSLDQNIAVRGDVRRKLISTESCYHRLFGDDLPVGMPQSRVLALKLANAQLYSLLSNPERCLPFLRFLNDELKRYTASNYPDCYPNVDLSQIDYVVSQGHQYPIPKLGSVYFSMPHDALFNKKYSALKEYLLLLYRKHGVGKQAVKWIGFVKSSIADQMVARGDFVIESGSSGLTLLHGTMSHIIQTAMMLYAIERGDIKMCYTEFGEDKKLTVAELLASQVQLKCRDGKHPWLDMRDTFSSELVQFCDPNMVSSIIMCSGESLGLDLLSQYLTDSFCKGIVKYHQVVKRHVPAFEDFHEFVDALLTVKAAEVANYTFMIEHAVNKYSLMENLSSGYASNQKRYSVTKGKMLGNTLFATARATHYRPCNDFMPYSFTADRSECYEVACAYQVDSDQAVYISGEDSKLGGMQVAYRMYFNPDRACWMFNLPTQLSNQDYQFFAGAAEHDMQIFDGENGTFCVGTSQLIKINGVYSIPIPIEIDDELNLSSRVRMPFSG